MTIQSDIPYSLQSFVDGILRHIDAKTIYAWLKETDGEGPSQKLQVLVLVDPRLEQIARSAVPSKGKILSLDYDISFASAVDERRLPLGATNIYERPIP